MAVRQGTGKGYVVTNSNKIHMTVNGNEFNGEGEDSLVRDLFNDWKQLLMDTKPATGRPTSPTPPNPSRFSRIVEEVKTKDGTIGATWDIFEVDEKKKLIALRVNPTGETRDADAILLLLYGFKQSWQADEVKVTTLKRCLAVSGLRPDRIDRTMASYIPQFVFKTGRGPGGKYRLTTPGFERADGLARSLFEQLV